MMGSLILLTWGFRTILFWSEIRESNPSLFLGKVALNRSTNLATLTTHNTTHESLFYTFRFQIKREGSIRFCREQNLSPQQYQSRPHKNPVWITADCAMVETINLRPAMAIVIVLQRNFPQCVTLFYAISLVNDACASSLHFHFRRVRFFCDRLHHELSARIIFHSQNFFRHRLFRFLASAGSCRFRLLQASNAHITHSSQ